MLHGTDGYELACDAHAIDNILCESEGRQLRGVEKPPLLESDSQVNVDNLSRAGVNEDVVQMPVPQANDVSCKSQHRFHVPDGGEDPGS